MTTEKTIAPPTLASIVSRLAHSKLNRGLGEREVQKVPKAAVTRREAEIYVTKLEAARRQIDAAIRMYLANEDGLAIHTVAAASYRITIDLLKTRGKSDLDIALRHGLFSLAEALARGKLTRAVFDERFGSGEGLWLKLSEIAEAIRDSKGGLTPDDIRINISQERQKKELDDVFKVPNFLKHADSDPHEVLNLAKVDNETLITRAIAAYTVLSNGKTFEMGAYWIWYIASGQTNDDIKALPVEIAQLVQNVAKLSPAKRRNACQKILRHWKQSST